MRMSAVTGINDNRVGYFGSIHSSSFNGMAHDDGIAAHGLYCQDCIPQAFAFDHAGRRGGDINHIGPQIFTGQFKRCAGTGTGLIEQINDRFAPQRGDLFNVPRCV